MTEIDHKALAKLREPFAAGQIGLLPKPYKKDSPKGNCRECGGYHGLPALHLDFVGHAALTDRFLDADIEWTWRPMAVNEQGLPVYDQFGGLWIWLTVGGVTRPGYGNADGKSGGNAVKEAIGDALRNGGMRFGAALDLWHKGDLHDAAEERGTASLNEEGRAELRELCKAKGLAPQSVADAFLARMKVAVADSTNEDIRAFIALVKQGVVEINGEAVDSGREPGTTPTEREEGQ